MPIVHPKPHPRTLLSLSQSIRLCPSFLASFRVSARTRYSTMSSDPDPPRERQHQRQRPLLLRATPARPATILHTQLRSRSPASKIFKRVSLLSGPVQRTMSFSRSYLQQTNNQLPRYDVNTVVRVCVSRIITSSRHVSCIIHSICDIHYRTSNYNNTTICDTSVFCPSSLSLSHTDHIWYLSKSGSHNARDVSEEGMRLEECWGRRQR